MLMSGHRVVAQCEWCRKTTIEIWRANEAQCLEKLTTMKWIVDLTGPSVLTFCSSECRELETSEK